MSSSGSSLPNSFSRSYSGTIGGYSFTINLTRDGNKLTGTASTNKTDSVYGEIDDSGNFTLKGYENDGSTQSGIYKGRISSDGSIIGNWTNTQGGQRTSFSLYGN